MARTRRAAAADPKHDTTDSRKQLKNTRPAREGRTGPLRAKRARSKKTGRLDEVDHDHRLEVARSVRQRLALDAPRAVESVEAPAVPNDGAADEPEPEVEKRKTKNETKLETTRHDVPPRHRRAVLPRQTASPSAVAPLVPRAIAPRAAAAVAAASAAGVASPVSAPVIKVRAADFPGASEFRAPPA